MQRTKLFLEGTQPFQSGAFGHLVVIKDLSELSGEIVKEEGINDAVNVLRGTVVHPTASASFRIQDGLKDTTKNSGRSLRPISFPHHLVI
ncbi:hypothetical protein GSS88_01185 [Corynebacterium sp. 3HC-13]|uniref:hypothetical protein n=1 Tax=Corynebacterium poyangense TaxID=2684405 RepID=UPI001CCA3B8D|nr:hypothetical protein [Corynebacterium poyangense]